MGEGLKKEFFSEVQRLWPVAKGCVSLVRKPCIRPGCRACAEGRKHPAYFFTYWERGKQRCLYVSGEMVPLLQKAIENGRRLEEKINQIGKELILTFRDERDKVKSGLSDKSRGAKKSGSPKR